MSREYPSTNNKCNSIAKSASVPTKQVSVWVSVFAPVGFLVIWSGGAIFVAFLTHDKVLVINSNNLPSLCVQFFNIHQTVV